MNEIEQFGKIKKKQKEVSDSINRDRLILEQVQKDVKELEDKEKH